MNEINKVLAVKIVKSRAALLQQLASFCKLGACIITLHWVCVTCGFMDGRRPSSCGDAYTSQWRAMSRRVLQWKKKRKRTTQPAVRPPLNRFEYIVYWIHRGPNEHGEISLLSQFTWTCGLVRLRPIPFLFLIQTPRNNMLICLSLH